MTFNQQTTFNFSNTQKPPTFPTQKPNGIFGSNTQTQAQSQAPLGFSFTSSFSKPTTFSSNQPQQQPQGHLQTQNNTQTQFNFGKAIGNGINGVNGTFANFGGFTQQKQVNNTFGQQKNDFQIQTLARNNAPTASSNGSAFANVGNFGLQNGTAFSFAKPNQNTNSTSNFSTSFNPMINKKKFQPIKSRNAKLDQKHVINCIAYAEENHGQTMKQLRAKFYMSGGNQQQNGNIIAPTSSFGFGNFNGGNTGNGGNFGGSSQGGASSFGFGTNGGNGFSFGTGNKNTGVGFGVGGNAFGTSTVNGNGSVFGGAFGGNNGIPNTMNSQTQSAFNFNINQTNNTFAQNNTNTPNNTFFSQNQFTSQKPTNNVFTNPTVPATTFGNNFNGVNAGSSVGANPVSGNAFSFGNQSHGNGKPQAVENVCFGQNNNCSQGNQNMQGQNQGVANGMFGPAFPQFGPQNIPSTLNVSQSNYSNQGLSFGTDLQYQSMLINSFLGSDLFRSMLANHKVQPFEQLTSKVSFKNEQQTKEVFYDYDLEREEYAKNRFSYQQNQTSNQRDGERQRKYGNMEFYKNPYIFTEPSSYQMYGGEFKQFDAKISRLQKVKNQGTNILKKTSLDDYQECFDKFQKKTLKEIVVKPEQLPTNDSNFILSPSLQKLSEMTPSELSCIPNMKFQNKFGRVQFKTPINILHKKFSESIIIIQDQVEIIESQWHNSRCEVLLKNFQGYVDLNEQEKRKTFRKIRRWVDKNKMTILQFDVKSGDLTFQFCY